MKSKYIYAVVFISLQNIFFKTVSKHYNKALETVVNSG